MNKFTKKNCIGILTILFVCLFFCINTIKFDNKIEIFYQAPNSNSLNDKLVEVYFDTGNGYEFVEGKYFIGKINKRHIALEIGSQLKNLQVFRIDFSSDSEKIGINKIVIRNGMFCVKTYAPEYILKHSSFINVNDVEIVQGTLFIEPMEGGSQCYFDNVFINEFQDIVNKYSELTKASIMILLLIGYCLICYLVMNNNLVEIIRNTDKIYLVGCILVIFAGILVTIMALLSVTYGHPDEDVTAAAIEYYLKYSRLPDFNTQEALNSFSNYGVSRLGEQTIYYFLAGKVGWIFKNIFHIFAYFRCLNVLLFWIMIGVYIKYAKKCWWLAVGILFTPQLWYVFSYATSDAWDYFVSFLVIFIIGYEESFFNKFICSQCIQRTISGISSLILLGGLFGVLFFGKKNYYIIFLLAFIILLFKLIVTEKKSILVKCYMIILFSFLLIVFVRIGIDQYVYQGQKQIELARLQQDLLTENDWAIIALGNNLKEQGVSLGYLLDEYGFFELSFKSFCGVYGWLQYKGSFLYYLVVFSVYMYMVVKQVKVLLISRNGMMWYQYTVVWGIILINFAISIYHSWTNDFQAQGRYMLPSILGLMWMISKSNKNESRSYVKYCYVLSLLACMSYIKDGLLNLL